MVHDQLTINERVVSIGRANKLVGILTTPPHSKQVVTALVLLSAGLRHRVGPNRLYVKLARTLASEGVAALRFDLPGIGDNLWGSQEDDAAATVDMAIDYLKTEVGANAVVCGGMCSGADLAATVALRRDDIKWLLLLNGGVPHSQHSLRAARAREHKGALAKRALQLSSWARALTGRSNYSAILRAGQSWLAGVLQSGSPERTNEEPWLWLDGLAARGVSSLLVLSDGCVSWHLLNRSPEAANAEAAARRTRLVYLKHCDHELGPLWAQARVLDAAAEWLRTARGVNLSGAMRVGA